VAGGVPSNALLGNDSLEIAAAASLRDCGGSWARRLHKTSALSLDNDPAHIKAAVAANAMGGNRLSTIGAERQLPWGEKIVRPSRPCFLIRLPSLWNCHGFTVGPVLNEADTLAANLVYGQCNRQESPLLERQKTETLSGNMLPAVATVLFILFRKGVDRTILYHFITRPLRIGCGPRDSRGPGETSDCAVVGLAI